MSWFRGATTSQSGVHPPSLTSSRPSLPPHSLRYFLPPSIPLASPPRPPSLPSFISLPISRSRAHHWRIQGAWPPRRPTQGFSMCRSTKRCSSKGICAAKLVTRRIFRARSVSKCVCRRGCAPDPTEGTYIIIIIIINLIRTNAA